MSAQTITEQLDEFIKTAGASKAAADSASSAGHVQNQGDEGTEHPSKSTDDGTQPAPEGARSAENTADVKSSVPGQSVDEASEDGMSGASEHPLTTAKPTGEDPAHETASADGLIGGEAGKDSKGKDTSHPAKVDFGGKYASVRELLATGQVKLAAQTIVSRANDFAAMIAAQPVPAATKSAEDSQCGKHGVGKGKEGEEGKKEANADEEAGAKAAAAVVSQMQTAVSGEDIIAHMAKSAVDDATAYCNYCEGLLEGAAEADSRMKQARDGAATLQARVKQAMEDEMAGADMLAQGGEGEVPGDTGEGVGGAGGADEELLSQIVEALLAQGIDPAELENIDPADLAQAIEAANMGGAEELPPEIQGEMAPVTDGAPDSAAAMM